MELIMKKTSKAILLLLIPAFSLAQNTVSGTVTDASTGDALPGANVVLEGTSMGAAAGSDGTYSISNVSAGAYTVTASVIGYANASKSVNVSGDVTVNLSLAVSAVELSALEVLASRSGQNSPTNSTTLTKAEMTLRLGSRDIPMVLNTTPSVYATEQGGGAGDARVNVRGFNQRNVGIMLNGIPVNDMENGWVYWSNWDGVGDATASIQMQRGLSDVNLAVPAIGGTMNIITDAAARKAGGSFKQEFGSWGFLKTTGSYNTGLIADKYAVSASVVRKTGDGFYKGTFTDAWAYSVNFSAQLNESNRIELYAIGAPQRHGQNLYKSNAGLYDVDYAVDELFGGDINDKSGKSLKEWYKGYNAEYQGRNYNQNYIAIPSSHQANDSNQYWYMYGANNVARYDKSYLMERENFFHKPQVGLNHYINLNDRMKLSSVLYYSGGSGGGTGTYGSMKWDYSGFSRMVDFAKTWDQNSTNTDTKYSSSEKRSKGILRNSINRQWTIGALTKFDMKLSDQLGIQAGVDWRTAEIEHMREVRDLLGGDYYVYTGNDFDTTPQMQMKKPGDPVAYNYVNTVDWLGLFASAKYASGPINAFGMFGLSTVGYTYKDRFTNVNGSPLTAENKGISGTQVKGGLRYNLSDDLGVYGNFGLVNKVPIFDAAINDYDGTVYENPELEKFTSFETGVDARLMNRTLTVKAGYYYTLWADRTNTRGVTNQDGTDGYIFLKGLDALHSGLELEVAYQPMPLFRADVAVSMGTWLHTDDVSGNYTEFDGNGNSTQKEFNYYIKDLKIGNAPQTQMALGLSLFPMEGLTSQFVYKYYADHYADWDPFSRTDASDRKQSWMIPNAGILDFHANWLLPVNLGGTKLSVAAHIFNVLDTKYIADATDNSRYGPLRMDSSGKWSNYYKNPIYDSHGPSAAEVYMGLPQRMNLSLNVAF